MAFSFTKEPTGIYPAYNDSFLEFSSTLTDNYKGEITVTALGLVIAVYADANGDYLFNLKDIVQALINANGFTESEDTPVSGFVKAFDMGYLSLDLTIKVYSDTANESTSKTYTFIRGVKQIGESVWTNTAQLLHPSPNGIDYNLTYFEGYPFSFELQRLTNTDSLSFKNLNTGDSTTAYVVGTTASHRVWVDKGDANWTSDSYLPLPDLINRIEVKVNAVVKSNVRIKKVAERCGVYLKWFNQDGGYSYFLFDEFHKVRLRGSERGLVSSNQFNNVGSLSAPYLSTGVRVEESMMVKATVDRNEAAHLRALISSPSVQLWSKQEPYVAGQWIDVRIKSAFSISNKKNMNEVSVDILMPELLTPTL